MLTNKKIVVVFAKKTGLEIIKKSIKHFDLKNTLFFCQGPQLKEIKFFFKKRKIKFARFSKEVKKRILKHKNAEFAWLLNLWGGEVFSSEILKKFRNSVNVHPSFLPFGRGRDPIVWGLIREEPLGFAFHKISKKIDSGKIYFRKQIDTEFPDTGAIAYKKVIRKIPKEFAEFWKKIKNKKTLEVISTKKVSSRINKRSDLLNAQTINLNKKCPDKTTILKLLAFDFSDKFSLQIRCNSHLYSARLKIKKLNE
jgi:folate-dependent phosphoribosylglycinamide formyltransferase PurN